MEIKGQQQSLDLRAPALLLLLLAALLVSLQSRADSLGILSQNMNRLYDDVDNGLREVRLSPAKFEARIQQASRQLYGKSGLAQIIALQEVENINVLRRIAQAIQSRHGVTYQAFLLAGNDFSSINLGYLVQSNLQVRRVEQLFADATIQNQPHSLFSRPPLLLETCLETDCITLVNLHLRSMRGIDNAATSDFVVQKRKQQAEAIARWAQRFQARRAQAKLMLLGDLNALSPADAHIDIVGTLRGDPDNSTTRHKAPDLLDPDLADLTQLIPRAQRYSYVFRQRRQQLDYMLANAPLTARIQHIRYTSIDYEFSDHAGLLARFDW